MTLRLSNRILKIHRNTILRYSLVGFTISLLLPLISSLYIMTTYNCSFIEAHTIHGNLLVWLIDVMPFFTATLTGFVGAAREKLNIVSDEYSSKLEHELEKLKEELESERKAAIHSAKFAALGEMSGGIAHEINNPMTVIKGLSRAITKFLEKEPIDVEKVIEMSHKVEHHCQRIIKIIQGLKTFSRDGSDDEYTHCHLNEILNDCLELCQEKIASSSIELKVDVDENSTFEAMNIHFSQVIVNLLNNSIDAVSELDQKWISIHSEVKNKMVVIRVSDSGAGIDEEIASKLFQPFYTTKAIGKGTGLGMSISKGIIEKHQGDIKYELHDGHTSFVIMVPYNEEYSEFSELEDKKLAS